jgi:hypothetical protein
MGRTVSQPTPHNEPMNGLWGEVGPGSTWRQFMKAYYAGKKPADWSRPTEVASITLCKLTGLPAPADVAPELAIQDLAVKPDPALPLGGCGAPAPAAGTPSGGPAGLPGILPSLSPLPTSLPPIVP